MAEKSTRTVTFQVKGQPPTEVSPALFSNFLALSRVGTEVQFEFIFIDLNQLALKLPSNVKEVVAVESFEGKTIAKIVMPASSFVHLKAQFNKVMAAIEKLVGQESEVEHGTPRASSR